VLLNNKLPILIESVMSNVPASSCLLSCLDFFFVGSPSIGGVGLLLFTEKVK